MVYPAAEITEPGVIKHNGGERFTLGEPDGSKSERLDRRNPKFNTSRVES